MMLFRGRYYIFVRLFFVFIFILTFSIYSFAQNNFISDYNIIDIKPLESKTNIIMPPPIDRDRLEATNKVLQEPPPKRVSTNVLNGLDTHTHSFGLDFGTTIFSMVSAPLAVNLSYEQKNGSTDSALKGKFGFRFTYTYRFAEKIELDATIGTYMVSAFYTNDKSFFNSDVYAIPFSAGVRIYYNKDDNASGFFLLPKAGGTIFITKATLYKGSTYIEGLLPFNRDAFVFDKYVALEFGFRIDLSRTWGIYSGIRPFIDISILDFGFSSVYLLRAVPLPRFSIGILF